MTYVVMAYRVMAYRVMAYRVMACIVMTYIVMAYVVMAYIVMAYIQLCAWQFPERCECVHSRASIVVAAEPGARSTCGYRPSIRRSNAITI